MINWSPIKYMGFYDVPLIFITRYRGETYLFDCPFDEEREDDSEFYNVYVLPAIGDEELPKDWTMLHERSTRFLGQVPVQTVRFDSTKRKAVDSSVIEEITARRAATGQA